MSNARKTLGTLSIVFGSLTLVWSPLSLLFVDSLIKGAYHSVANLPRAPGHLDPALRFGATEALQAARHGYDLATTLINVVMSAALVVAGIGLVRRKKWGHQGALLWSRVALGIVTVQLIAFFTYLRPLQERVTADYFATHHLPVPMAMHTGTMSGIVGATLIVMIDGSFPAVLLAVLSKRLMAEEFTA